MTKRPAAIKPTDDGAFDAFWCAYPRRDDKGHARKAWSAAIKKADPNVIIAGLRAYRFDPNPRFQPLPSTWLNGERWIVDERAMIDPVLTAAGLTIDDLADPQ